MPEVVMENDNYAVISSYNNFIIITKHKRPVSNLTDWVMNINFNGTLSDNKIKEHLRHLITYMMFCDDAVSMKAAEYYGVPIHCVTEEMRTNYKKVMHALHYEFGTSKLGETYANPSS